MPFSITILHNNFNVVVSQPIRLTVISFCCIIHFKRCNCSLKIYLFDARFVYRLGHCPFTAGRGVRFPYRVPYVSADTGIVVGRYNYSGSPGRGRVLTQQISALELLA